ncbi:MAG: hypothetical protein KGD64_09825 [Candidatus Heimdallarchaeota archaeon]|nr:hypothetical protein [Candidatus Heimdallarchaeota archaeon]
MNWIETLFTAGTNEEISEESLVSSESKNKKTGANNDELLDQYINSVNDDFSSSLTQVNFTDDLNKALEGADCIVLLADHAEYRELSFSHLEQVANIPYIFIDTKNIITVDSDETRKIVKIGV